MSNDPAFNCVVFNVVRCGQEEKIVGQAQTRDAACIRAAWAAVQHQTGVQPSDVTSIYSEWEPSAEDRAWLDATFAADLKLSYSFDRPRSEAGWEEAFRTAAAGIRSSMDRKKKRWWEFWK